MICIFVRVHINYYMKLKKKAKRPEIAVEYAESYIQCRDSLDKQLSASSTIRALGQNYEKERLKSENQRLQNEQLRRRMHYLIILHSLSAYLLQDWFGIIERSGKKRKCWLKSCNNYEIMRAKSKVILQ